MFGLGFELVTITENRPFLKNESVPFKIVSGPVTVSAPDDRLTKKGRQHYFDLPELLN